MLISYYYLIMVALLVAMCLSYFFCKKKLDTKLQLIQKVVSLVLATIFLVRYLWDNEAIQWTQGLQTSLFSNGFFACMSMISIWLFYIAILLFVLYPFFNIKYRDFFAKWIATPIVILNIITFVLTIKGVCGEGAMQTFSVRALIMCFELAICGLYCFYVWNKDSSFKWSKKDALVFVFSLLGMLIATMPAYAPQFFLGKLNDSIIIDNLTFYHRIFLYFAFIIPVTIYFALRKNDTTTNHFALLFLSLGGLITFMAGARFASWLEPASWPIHLCNTAMYIVPLCLIFKWDKLFYFTFFINVLGAFFAMAMPNTTGNVISYEVIRFWNNHYMAFFMPLLIVALNIYKRPKLREFIYSSVAFTVYFVLVVFLNSWFTGLGKDVDYFFVNSDFIAEKLGQWAEDLRDYKWSFTISNVKFVFYPLYQFLFWIVYMLLASGMWFLYEQSYNYFDIMIDMSARRKKYKLDMLAIQSKLNGKEITSPMDEKNSDKLILRNFTKRYGKSEVYAVKDVNLEVHGGEIFGFLGPNGAGKSTIIKTIVGIQPITSGEIEVCGYDAKLQSTMAKKQIGFVPDHYALYEKLTGREYINYIADLYGVSRADRDARIEKYVTLFELTGAFDNQIKTYSHGMKQKIAIMSALVHNPKVWILDEPLTGLDPNSIFQVKECMKNHAKEGNIVFFSSHIIDVVERICDRIGIIKKGQLQVVKSVQDILNSGEALEDFYMNIINNNNVEAIKVDKEQLEKDKEEERKDKKHQREIKKQERLEKKKQKALQKEQKRKQKLEEKEKVER